MDKHSEERVSVGGQLMLALCGSQGASISGALEGQERELIQLVSHYAFEGLWEVCAESVETNEPRSLPHRTHH